MTVLHPRVLCVAALAVAGSSSPVSSAPAQERDRQTPPSLVGVWSGYLTRAQGVTPVTAQFRSDGGFDAVMIAPMAAFPLPIYEHFWGRYEATPRGGEGYDVRLMPAGQAPSEICLPNPTTGVADCRPVGFSQATIRASAQFLSPDRYRDETGAIYTRIDTPGLLAQPVANRLVIALPEMRPICRTGSRAPYCGKAPLPQPMEPVRCNDGTQPITYPDGRRVCLRH